jgi:hypothetical protein
MNSAEYVSVLVSIVVGLALVVLLASGPVEWLARAVG